MPESPYSHLLLQRFWRVWPSEWRCPASGGGRRHAAWVATRFALLYLGHVALIVVLSVLMFLLLGLLYLNRDLPVRRKLDSALALQPSLAIVPRPDSLTSLIKFRVGFKSEFAQFVQGAYSFVQNYEEHKRASYLVDCTNNVPYPDNHRYSCKYPADVGQIGCNIGSDFGYDETFPCVAVKMNRVLDWVPEFQIPVPASGNRSNAQPHAGPLLHGHPTVKVKCEGVNDADKEELAGKICYYDEEAALRDPKTLSGDQDGGCSLEYGQIRNYYFPYKKQNSYMSPYVWLRFLGLRRHVVIMVQCWTMVDNIVVNFELGQGSVSFEILID